MTAVKICGLRTPEEVDAAVEAGAEYLGFNTFARSPRYVTADRRKALAEHVAGRSSIVVLLVDPRDDEVESAVRDLEPDYIQLHGSETPERCADIAAGFGLPVIKAVAVHGRADLDAAIEYEVEGGVSHLLYDAKPPEGADRQGGHGVAFDWTLLAPNPLIPANAGTQAFSGSSVVQPVRGGGANEKILVPRVRGDERSVGERHYGRLWFLAGGLTPANVGEAIRITRAPVVDVSSGVESSPGVKDPALIRAFIQAVRDADREA